MLRVIADAAAEDRLVILSVVFTQLNERRMAERKNRSGRCVCCVVYVACVAVDKNCALHTTALGRLRIGLADNHGLTK